jgi:glycosyltransferase involved in cell wall biosynthesis
MRVLMLSDVYFPRVNGVSTSIQTFRAGLGEQGVTVQLIAPDYALESPRETGLRRIPGQPVPGDPEDRRMVWSALKEAAHAAAKACDIVHIQTPFLAHYAGLRAARTFGKPVIATYHTLFEEYLQHYAPWLPAPWLRATARRFSRGQCNDLDAVVVPSTAMHQRLREYGVRVPLHVLPTGIPLRRFRQGDGGEFRRRHGLAPETPVALYVGRVAHEKNIDFLIDVRHRLRHDLSDLTLLITGEGPARASLQAQVEQLGLTTRVRFLGYLDRQRELPDAYAAADVFVFASRTETQGLVLLEAMAMGLPVIALAEMGTKDILTPGRGCLVPENTVEAFAASVQHFFQDADMREQLQRTARETANDWSDEAMATRLMALYASLLRG